MKTRILIVLTLSMSLILGCSKKEQSTISVLGTGTVLVQPDVMQMSISLSNVARTTQLAQQAVNTMIRQALAILAEAGIEEKNITTASLTFRSEYEYTYRRVLVGQRAEQRIIFSVDNIDNDSDRASQIIDKLIQINGIELSQIDFSVRNNTAYFVKSRDLAFHKALEKANQYAELSNLKVGKVLSITEDSMQNISPIHNRFLNNQVMAEAEATSMDRGYGSTIVSAGEMEITTRISVVFLLK